MDELNTSKITKDLLKKFEKLKKEMSDDDLKLFKETDADGLIDFHFSLGMYIRNEWGLWGDSDLNEYFCQKRMMHPDDMSGILLEMFHQYLHGKEINLDEDLLDYL
ncbi:MAG: DUF6794 domain-containing protein [bacterium]